MTDYAAARRNMVEGQLRTNKVTDRRLLDALSEISRERFVPPAQRGVAYVDEDLPIGQGRFLMEPMVLARLVQLAAIDPGDRVLDIGPGSGYSSAVLARLAGRVVALESDPSLAEAAKRNLAELGIGNVQVVTGNLAGGYPKEAPYQAILLNGAVERVPPAIVEQLAEGGRLVGVVGPSQGAAGIGRATLMQRVSGTASSRIAFDAAVAPLPGFQAEPGFVF
ncbi:MAG: protein-L-isoaspartate O-methyltransferase [Proteobacteria bacterium]|nr:protein-L-isoaspartate O-methyltransferase [Pseudomonadota bacterium]MBI3495980.1 protein-L-isoaspartate O-methyltransferase [Pseudomonadota bacterium]